MKHIRFLLSILSLASALPSAAWGAGKAVGAFGSP